MKSSHVNTLIIGSGAAGLCCALRLFRSGVRDLLIVTESLQCGTSINTGSDKQTYYKTGLYGGEADSPRDMAESYTAGGSVHGDLALVESALSANCFLHLCQLGVPFPHDQFGQYIGYKTDHDPRRRATSCGPYTSKEMCSALIREIRAAGIPVQEHRVAVKLLKCGSRAAGAVIWNRDEGVFEYCSAENTVFAVGGPGGLYAESVYPACHTGAIGIALEAGVKARNLPESQFGLASTTFRWNVSGTYMQVLPRFVSTRADGSDPREFLRDHFSDAELCSKVFLKGYQWPFDVNKLPGGSSMIDVLVYKENAAGRRTFLDFRTNPAGLDISQISEEAREYLQRSGACSGTPLERLLKMNPGAVELYAAHGIDLKKDMLEIAVCAQHNNGGLAGNIWFESENTPGLFPIGEVNGSHGVTRPGGSALNAGQVGAFRAAEYISHKKGEFQDVSQTAAAALRAVDELKKMHCGNRDWRKDLQEIRRRMSDFAGFQRPANRLRQAENAAFELWKKIKAEGYPPESGSWAFVVAQLAFSSWVYLSAIRFQYESGTGSRGSAALLDENGGIIPEDRSFRTRILTSWFDGEKIEHDFEECRPVPCEDGWFENVWADCRSGKIWEIEQ